MAAGLPSSAGWARGDTCTTCGCPGTGGETWAQREASAAWSPRAQLAAVLLRTATGDGDTLLVGGEANGTVADPLWRSSTCPLGALRGTGGNCIGQRIDDASVGWNFVSVTPMAPWGARYGLSAATARTGVVFMLGGFDDSSKRDIWKSADRGDTWELVLDDTPWWSKAGDNLVVLPDGRLYSPGGWDHYSSSDGGLTWDFHYDAPEISSFFAVALHTGEVMLGGGSEYGNRVNVVW